MSAGRRRRLPRFLVFALIAIPAVGIASLVWLRMPVGKLMAEAESALASDAAVTVNQSPWLTFEPTELNEHKGFISTRADE